MVKKNKEESQPPKIEETAGSDARSDRRLCECLKIFNGKKLTQCYARNMLGCFGYLSSEVLWLLRPLRTFWLFRPLIPPTAVARLRHKNAQSDLFYLQQVVSGIMFAWFLVAKGVV